jgi:hypothetical protein
MTGNGVYAASMPGKAAAPPAEYVSLRNILTSWGAVHTCSDDDLYSSSSGIGRNLSQLARRPVRRDDINLPWDAELP